VPVPAAATKTRMFRLSGTRINRKDMDMDRIDAAVTRGTTEIWEVTNADGALHNFHVHDVQFRVLGGSLGD
jgi:blue copper oxidase